MAAISAIQSLLNSLKHMVLVENILHCFVLVFCDVFLAIANIGVVFFIL